MLGVLFGWGIRGYVDRDGRALGCWERGGGNDGVVFVLPIFMGWDEDGEGLGVCVGGHYDSI